LHRLSGAALAVVLLALLGMVSSLLWAVYLVAPGTMAVNALVVIQVTFVAVDGMAAYFALRRR
jgi:hypothetical protein